MKGAVALCFKTSTSQHQLQQTPPHKTTVMSLTKQLQKIIDAHVLDVISQLAVTYDFDAAEAKASIVGASDKSKKPPKPRAANAFMRFSKEQRPHVKAEEPDLAPKDILRSLGRRWQALSDDEKLPYKEAYELAKQQLQEGSSAD